MSEEKCCSQTDASEEGSENEAIYSDDDDESETENIEDGTSPLVDGMCTGIHSHFFYNSFTLAKCATWVYLVDQGEGGFPIYIFTSKGENSNKGKRRGRKKNGAGSEKGSRRKRKGRLIEDALIGKKALSSILSSQKFKKHK